MADYLKISSPEEFKKILEYNSNNYHIKSESVDSSITIYIHKVDFTLDSIDLSRYERYKLVFNDCKGIASNLILKGKAYFNNCKFKQIDATQIELDGNPFELKDCTIETIKAGSITRLIKCTITYLLINTTPKSERKKLRLSDNSSIDDLNILNCYFNLIIEDKSNIILKKVRIYDIQNEDLSFEGITILELEIWNLSQPLYIFLKNITTIQSVIVNASTLSSMEIENCNILKLLFDSQKLCDSLRVKNSIIKDFILKNYVINILSFTGLVTIENLICHLAYKSKISNWHIRPQNIENQSLIRNFICIDGTIPSDAEVNFANIAIESIIFWNVSNLGKFVFSGITVNKILDYNDSVIHIDLVIKKCKEERIIPESLNWNWGEIPQNAFYIINSDLGKANFYNCTFKSMNLFMVGAKINEINISDSEWPQKLYTPSEDIKTNLPRQYAQLRKIHETVGDTVKAGMYQAEELNAFHQSLKFIKGHRAEKFNLWLNKYTNYFGQDYVRAFCVTIISSLFFYTLYCLSLGFSFDIHSKKSLDNFWNIAANFLEFINPIHKADYIASILLDVKEDQLKPYKLARLIDILSRMLNGYFIYQFIQAFRKYGKR